MIDVYVCLVFFVLGSLVTFSVEHVLIPILKRKIKEKVQKW